MHNSDVSFQDEFPWNNITSLSIDRMSICVNLRKANLLLLQLIFQHVLL